MDTSQKLTAGDLMSRDVKSIRVDTPLREAAVQLARWEVHGAPVVDDSGRCVGVLSVTDVTRWVSWQDRPRTEQPRTCSFQETYREPGGRETVLCKLPKGVCSFQRIREMTDGKIAIACCEAHCVPTDWQMVEVDSLPKDAVRDYMTTALQTTRAETPVDELARQMLANSVRRLIVVDPAGCPVGIVTVDDLLQVMAHPEVVPTAKVPS